MPTLSRLWKYHLDRNHNTERQPDLDADAPIHPAGGTPLQDAERPAPPANLPDSSGVYLSLAKALVLQATW